MKGKIMIGFVSLTAVIIAITLIITNIRTVYLYNPTTNQTSVLTSIWWKQNEIEIKDRWFDDFEETVITGIIYIEDKEEYAIIPYSFTRYEDDGDVADFYHQKLHRVKAVNWITKTEEARLDFTATEDYKLWVAVGDYHNTSYDETEFGYGIYSVPIYTNDGELYYHLQFTDTGVTRILDDFNEGEPCYIRQEFLFTEVSLTNQSTTTFLLPIQFIGGLTAQNINDTHHYYYEYNEHTVVFEALLDRVE